eukprot:SAG11_NODE_2631_length_3155_cov_2.254908_5_plen_77_part_00
MATFEAATARWKAELAAAGPKIRAGGGAVASRAFLKAVCAIANPAHSAVQVRHEFRPSQGAMPVPSGCLRRTSSRG